LVVPVLCLLEHRVGVVACVVEFAFAAKVAEGDGEVCLGAPEAGLLGGLSRLGGFESRGEVFSIQADDHVAGPDSVAFVEGQGGDSGRDLGTDLDLGAGLNQPRRADRAGDAAAVGRLNADGCRVLRLLEVLAELGASGGFGEDKPAASEECHDDDEASDDDHTFAHTYSFTVCGWSSHAATPCLAGASCSGTDHAGFQRNPLILGVGSKFC
jgi:hypothetical protein